MPATALKKKLAIDYPKLHERITSERYTFRLSATVAEGEFVLVSVDDAPAQPCRVSDGHWWFDWDGYRSHHHRLVARIVASNGDVVSEAARRFLVALGDERSPAALEAESAAAPIAEDDA